MSQSQPRPHQGLHPSLHSLWTEALDDAASLDATPATASPVLVTRLVEFHTSENGRGGLLRFMIAERAAMLSEARKNAGPGRAPRWVEEGFRSMEEHTAAMGAEAKRLRKLAADVRATTTKGSPERPVPSPDQQAELRRLLVDSARRAYAKDQAELVRRIEELRKDLRDDGFKDVEGGDRS